MLDLITVNKADEIQTEMFCINFSMFSLEMLFSCSFFIHVTLLLISYMFMFVILVSVY